MRLAKGQVRWEVFRDRAKRWRFHAVAANNRVVEASEQSFATRAYAARQAVKAGAPALISQIKDVASGVPLTVVWPP